MASKDYLKHVVSTSEPIGSTLGDEYNNPSSNQLFKRLAVNGTSVQWVEQQQGITVQANTTTVATAPRTVNFAGAGVSTTASGSTVTVTVAGGGASTPITISNKTGAYTVVASDAGTIINCTSGTFTVSLTAAATLGSGFNVTIWNTSTTSTDTITIDPDGAETIDGLATLILRAGEGMQVICNGTNWETGNKKVMRGYAEKFSNSGVARPVASGNLSTAIGRFATASGIGSFAYNYGSTSSNDYTIAFGASTTASAAYSTAIGGNAFLTGAQATGSGAIALGASYASGVESFAAVITDNTSSYGARAANALAIGKQAQATVASAIAIGNQTQATGAGGYCLAIGYQAQATAPGAISIGNQYNVSVTQATGSSSTAIGDGVVAQGQYSVALGAAAKSVEYGKYSKANGFFAVIGDNQRGGILLRIATTDATATRLTSDAGAAGTTNQLILPNSSAYTFTGIIVARQQAAGGTASAAWKIEGLIRREGTAASTTLVASTVTAISNVPAWAIALTADTTNGGLAITATGAAATNIRWVATLDTSEVTYA